MHVTNIMECSNICVQAGAPGVTGQPAGGCISRSQAGAGRPGPGSVLGLSVALSSTQRISRYGLCHYHYHQSFLKPSLSGAILPGVRL